MFPQESWKPRSFIAGKDQLLSAMSDKGINGPDLVAAETAHSEAVTGKCHAATPAVRIQAGVNAHGDVRRERHYAVHSARIGRLL